MHNEMHDLTTDQEDSSTPTAMVAPSANEPSGSDAEAAPEQDLVALRLNRITDYLDSVLHDPLPEVALIGGLNADLGKLAVGLGQSINEVLAACRDAREYLDTVPHAADVLLKVSRQIERGARLARDLSREQQGNDANTARNGGLLEQNGEIAI